jgi:hypothetical protein
MSVFCIEALPKTAVMRAALGGNRGATYGCSRKLEEAVAALERGRKRGVTFGEIVERKSVPRGTRMNQWLPPFDDRKAGFR